MSTSVSVLDRVVAAACSDGPSVEVSEGQTVDQPERSFADVQAAAQTRSDGPSDKINCSDPSGVSSVENGESVAGAGEPVAESVRREEPDVGQDEGVSVPASGPEVVLFEIAVEAAEIEVSALSVAGVDEKGPLDSLAVAEPAAVAQQGSALTDIEPVGPVAAQRHGAAIETQAIVAEGFSDKANSPAVAEELVLADGSGRRAAPEPVSPDSIAGVLPKAGGEALAATDGALEQDAAGGGGLVSAPEQVNGAKPLDEGAALQQDSEAMAHRFGEEPSLKEASAAAEKPGETSRQAEPQGSERGLETLREIEKSVDDRQGESRGGDGADGAVLFARHAGVAASETTEGQAGSSDFSAGANVAVEPGVLVETDSKVAPQQIAAQTLSPGSAQEAKVTNATPNIREQILDSMQALLARGDRQLVVRLHPPELGSIVVRFQGGDGQIDATLEVSKAETRYEVEQALPQVVHGLQDSGVQIRRFEVMVADESERDLAKEQTQQEAWPQQQGSDPYTDHAGGPAGSGWSAGDGDHQGHREYAGTSLPPIGQAADHIDLLM